jgi:hypothetical protein
MIGVKHCFRLTSCCTLLRCQNTTLCLMARAAAYAVVAMEALVKQRQVAPMRIAMTPLRTAVNRPVPVFAAR